MDRHGGAIVYTALGFVDVSSDKQVAKLMVVIACITAELASFCRICQVAPMCMLTSDNGFLGPCESAAKQHLNHFSHFAGLVVVTNTQTTLHRDVCINIPHLALVAVLAMRLIYGRA